MGAQAPAVSVVLPTRDRRSFLEPSIQSVLAQDHDDLELIVVDDGSTDGTAEFLVSITDPRLRVLRNSVSLGPAGARNRAIAVAAGQVIAFQDSDDVWRPGALRRLLEALETGGADCVVAYSPVEMPGIGRIPGPCDEVRSGDLSLVLTRYSIVGLPAAVVWAEALAKIGGFDERLHRLEDWDLFLALSQIGTFAYTDELLIDVGVGNDRVSTREAESYDALDVILGKHSDLFREVPVLRAAHHLRLARWFASSRRAAPTAAQLTWLLGHPAGAARALATHARHASPLDRARCLRES